jgi:O-antigen/teichoic acid export membrane protein
MRDLLSFGGNVSIARLLWFFFTQADVLIVGKLLGKEMLGLYSVAMHLASLPVQRVSSILNQVAFPVLSRLQNDRTNLSGYLLSAMRVLSFFAFPVLWGISCTANEIVPLLLGQNWTEAILPLQLLSLMMPWRMVANFLPTATDAIGRPDLGLRNVLLASLVMPVAFLIASQWGIVGVAVAWVTVYPLVLLINVWQMLKVIGLRLGDLFHAIAPAVGSAAGMYAAVWGTRWLLGTDLNQLNKLVAMIVIGALIYGGLTLILNKQGYREVYGLMQRN